MTNNPLFGREDVHHSSLIVIGQQKGNVHCRRVWKKPGEDDNWHKSGVGGLSAEPAGEMDEKEEDFKISQERY